MIKTPLSFTTRWKPSDLKWMGAGLSLLLGVSTPCRINRMEKMPRAIERHSGHHAGPKGSVGGLVATKDVPISYAPMAISKNMVPVTMLYFFT